MIRTFLQDYFLVFDSFWSDKRRYDTSKWEFVCASAATECHKMLPKDEAQFGPGILIAKMGELITSAGGLGLKDKR